MNYIDGGYWDGEFGFEYDWSFSVSASIDAAENKNFDLSQEKK